MGGSTDGRTDGRTGGRTDGSTTDSLQYGWFYRGWVLERVVVLAVLARNYGITGGSTKEG